jgi:putative membrane protein
MKATFVARGALGGVLMGLANLVPGISGGTMLLATGVYRRFIEAVAEITTLKFRVRSVLFLLLVAGTALLAIALLAGPIKTLVENHRWVMYSVFIGLTLGGVPLVWRRARPPNGSVWLGALIGFLAMGLMAFARPTSGGDDGVWVLLVVAGIAGASAMILPGVSGAYLLLVLGQYETILGAVDQCKHGQFGDAWPVILPVAVGIVIGIAGVSNLMRWALEHKEKVTLGVLLGLLFGSVLGIWPFQEAVEAGEPRVYFAPTVGQVAAALGLVVLGFGATVLIGRLDREGR